MKNRDKVPAEVRDQLETLNRLVINLDSRLEVVEKKPQVMYVIDPAQCDLGQLDTEPSEVFRDLSDKPSTAADWFDEFLRRTLWSGVSSSYRSPEEQENVAEAVEPDWEARAFELQEEIHQLKDERDIAQGKAVAMKRELDRMERLSKAKFEDASF